MAQRLNRSSPISPSRQPTVAMEALSVHRRSAQYAKQYAKPSMHEQHRAETNAQREPSPDNPNVSNVMGWQRPRLGMPATPTLARETLPAFPPGTVEILPSAQKSTTAAPT